jgi:Flp pilus assembly pilin Flp
MKTLTRLVNEEKGAVMAEYAMLLAMLADALIGAITLLRDQIVAIFNKTASTLQAAS